MQHPVQPGFGLTLWFQSVMEYKSVQLKIASSLSSPPSVHTCCTGRTSHPQTGLVLPRFLGLTERQRHAWPPLCSLPTLPMAQPSSCLFPILLVPSSPSSSLSHLRMSGLWWGTENTVKVVEKEKKRSWTASLQPVVAFAKPLWAKVLWGESR